MRYPAYAGKLKTSEQHKIAYQFAKEFCNAKSNIIILKKCKCGFFILLDYIHTIFRAALKSVLQKHYMFSCLSLSSLTVSLLAATYLKV